MTSSIEHQKGVLMVKLEGMRREYTDHFEKLANSALNKYPLQFDRLQFVGYFTNCILFAESGTEKYALRISSPGWRTFSDLKSEAIWLHDLTAGSDIGVVDCYDQYRQIPFIGIL